MCNATEIMSSRNIHAVSELVWNLSWYHDLKKENTPLNANSMKESKIVSPNVSAKQSGNV
jgi:hypothetical protein